MTVVNHGSPQVAVDLLESKTRHNFIKSPTSVVRMETGSYVYNLVEIKL
jgi:hypothetical protein